MKRIALLLFCILAYANAFSQNSRNNEIVYHIPQSVKQIFNDEIIKNNIKDNGYYSYYIYLFNYRDTIKLVLSKYDKQKPDAISQKILLKSNRCVQIDKLSLPILLESDIKMSDVTIKIDGNLLLHETLFMPKGLQVNYKINDQGFCEVLSKRYVE
jgi:hypothetical protein